MAMYTAVSTSVVTQQQLSEPSAEAPRARPCRVTTADRSVRKGIMVHSLEDLHVKVRDTLMLAYKPFFLVLEEDGTTVETEEYFQSLADDTVFMVLHKGQKWQPPSEQSTRYQLALSHKPAKIDVARVTFDLYKVNPQDFIGCLNVKATLYGTYSVSYDLHCSGAKRIMNGLLRNPTLDLQSSARRNEARAYQTFLAFRVSSLHFQSPHEGPEAVVCLPETTLSGGLRPGSVARSSIFFLSCIVFPLDLGLLPTDCRLQNLEQEVSVFKLGPSRGSGTLT
ncbi:lipid transferase CIDEC isoform X2 [Bos mutus]|uniref:lipid transferase CIDEC isoform X2 n=1 Tax=Bos mutus TaxID=72004 RepID=UPI0038B67E63